MAVRWGLLSTARINGALIGGIREAQDAELVAVASRSEEAARAYAEANGIPRAHGSYEALLADPEVDVVYVPLPNSMHVPWSVAALEAGKHVLCEKPMAREVAPVEAAFDAAERAGKYLVEAFMWRYHAQTDRLAELVRDGAVGTVRHVRTAFSFTLPTDAANVRWAPELEGGALMDVGCYCVSALRLLVGEPERVSAEAVDNGGVDARMTAVLRFAGDATGSLECAFDTVPRSLIEVVGDQGTLLSADPWHGGAPSLVRTGADGAHETIGVEAVNPYAREVDDLSAAVQGGPAPRLGRADAVGQARTIAALYRSAAEGRAVTP